MNTQAQALKQNSISIQPKKRVATSQWFEGYPNNNQKPLKLPSGKSLRVIQISAKGSTNTQPQLIFLETGRHTQMFTTLLIITAIWLYTSLEHDYQQWRTL